MLSARGFAVWGKVHTNRCHRYTYLLSLLAWNQIKWECCSSFSYSYWTGCIFVTFTFGLNSTDKLRFTVITADDATNANINFVNLLILEIPNLYLSGYLGLNGTSLFCVISNPTGGTDSIELQINPHEMWKYLLKLIDSNLVFNNEDLYMRYIQEQVVSIDFHKI